MFLAAEISKNGSLSISLKTKQSFHAVAFVKKIFPFQLLAAGHVLLFTTMNAESNSKNNAFV
jgi:hypothetical protein